MTKPLRTQFVIADAARARWVARSPTADDFVTAEELKAAHHPHSGGPQGVVFEGSTGARFTVAERNSAVREHQGRFAIEIAEAINTKAAAGVFERLVVVAPARMLGAIREHLNSQAKKALAKTLAKDLTKTPDHELGHWLRTLELG